MIEFLTTTTLNSKAYALPMKLFFFSIEKVDDKNFNFFLKKTKI